jgi:hypothetical protein
MYAIVKPVLAQEIIDKVEIYGTDYREKLLEIVDEESLPSFLGGKCTCSEHGGCLAGYGPWFEVEPEERVEEKIAEKIKAEDKPIEDKPTVELVEVSTECIITTLSHSF